MNARNPGFGAYHEARFHYGPKTQKEKQSIERAGA